MKKSLLMTLLALLASLDATAGYFRISEIEEGFFRVEDPNASLKLKQKVYLHDGKTVGQVVSLNKGSAKIKQLSEQPITLNDTVFDILPEPTTSAAPTPPTSASVPLPPAPAGDLESRDRGLDGLSRIFLISGGTQIGGSSYRIGTTEYDQDTNQTAWGMTYLMHLSGSLWAGPTLSYQLSSTSRNYKDGDHQSISNNQWSPGVQLRGVLRSGADQYVSLFGGISYNLFSLDSSASSGGISSSEGASGNGFGFGGGLVFGQRLGQARAYLLETQLGVAHNSLSGTYKSGSTSTSASLSGTAFVVGIAIGVALE